MNHDVIIYRRDSGAHLIRLAQRDSQRPPDGPVLVAEVNGEARAALPLHGGPPIADPFHCTAELVSLLEVRAAQLGATKRRPVRSRRPQTRRPPQRALGSTHPGFRIEEVA